jgi:Tfp pilus assembly protein PilO
MEIGSLSANRNLLIIIGLIVEIALGAVFYIYYYQPRQVRITELETIVAKKQKQVREIQVTQKLLEETKQEIARLKSEIVRIERFFPENVFVPRVLVLVENLAEATNMNVESLKPASKGRKGGKSSVAREGASRPAPAASAKDPTKIKFDEKKEYSTSDIEFKASGTFRNLHNFMNELTTFPKLVVVDTLVLAPGKTNDSADGGAEREIEIGEHVMLKVEMPLTFYIQKQQQPEFDQ